MSDVDHNYFVATGLVRPKTYPFYVSETNPNPTGKCLCEHASAGGPYIIFPGDMLDVAAPRPVLCADCVGDCAVVIDNAEPFTPFDGFSHIELPAQDVVELEDEVVGL
jgi:hypothetical protein